MILISDCHFATADLSNEMNKIHNHILFNRELCKTFMDEVAFLTVTNHTQMAELVRLSHMSRQALHELDPFLDVKKLQVLLVSWNLQSANSIVTSLHYYVIHHPLLSFCIDSIILFLLLHFVHIYNHFRIQALRFVTENCPFLLCFCHAKQMHVSGRSDWIFHTKY